MKEFHIVGGGIAGLSIAHILVTRFRNTKVNLYESNDYLGGKVAMTNVDGFLQEHSPRVFSNSYVNFFNLMRDVKVNDKETIYDKMTRKTKGFIVQQDCNKIDVDMAVITSKLHFGDLVRFGYYMTRGLFLSDQRLEDEYDNLLVKDVLKHDKSKKIIEYVSYIVGENMDVLPMSKLTYTDLGTGLIPFIISGSPESFITNSAPYCCRIKVRSARSA